MEVKLLWLPLFILSSLAVTTCQAQEFSQPEVYFVRDLPFRIHDGSWGCVAICDNRLITGYTVLSSTQDDQFFLCQYDCQSGHKTSQVQIPATDWLDFKIAGSADGSLIAIAYQDCLDLRSATACDQTRNRIELPFPSDEIEHLALSPDGSEAALSLQSGLVATFDCRTGKQLRQTVLGNNSGARLVYSTTGELYLLSGQALWQWTKQDLPQSLCRFADQTIKAALITDSAIYLIHKGKAGILEELLETDVMLTLAKFSLDGSPIWKRETPGDTMGLSTGFSTERLVLASATRIFQIDQSSGVPAEIGKCDYPQKLTFSPNGNLLISDSLHRGFQVWSTDGWKSHPANSLPFNHVYSAVVDDQGKLTVQSLTHTWQAEWNQPLAHPVSLPEDVTGVSSFRSMSADAQWFAYADTQGVVRRVNLAQGIDSQTIVKPPSPTHPAIVEKICLCEDGSQLLIASHPIGETAQDAASKAFRQGLGEGLGGIGVERHTLPAEIIELGSLERVQEFDIGGIEIGEVPELTASGDYLAMRTTQGFQWVYFSKDRKPRRRRIPVDCWDLSLSENGALLAATKSGDLVVFESFDSRPKVLHPLHAPKEIRVVTKEFANDGKTAYVGISGQLSGPDPQNPRVFAIDLANNSMLWSIPLPHHATRLQLSPSGNFLLVEIGTELQWAVIKLQ